MYQIEGTFQVEDYLQALRLGRHGKLFITRMISYVLIGILLIIVGYSVRVFGSSSSYVAIGILAVIVLIVMALVFEIYVPIRAKRIFNQQKDLHLPFTMKFSKGETYFENSQGQSTRSWNSFHKWKENDKLFLLYHSDALFTPIPKRLMTSETIAFIREQLKKNNTPKK